MMQVTFLHELDEGDDPFGVLPRVPERSLKERLELGKLLALEPTEDIDVVLW